MNTKTVSIDHYLKTIYELQCEKGTVRHIDIAVKMSFSKPSVTRAIRVLKDMGYITASEYAIKLTKDGVREAKKLLDNYQTICNFLVSIGVSENAADHDACTLEHDISAETFSQFRKCIKCQEEQL